jgi:hypothetical protein
VAWRCCVCAAPPYCHLGAAICGGAVGRDMMNRTHSITAALSSRTDVTPSSFRKSPGFHRKCPVGDPAGAFIDVQSLLLACLPVWRLSSRCLFTSFSNCHFDDARMVLYSYFGLCLSFQFSLFPTSRRPVIVFQLPN